MRIFQQNYDLETQVSLMMYVAITIQKVPTSITRVEEQLTQMLSYFELNP